MESTNFIFSNILSVEMGEMDYGEDEALHFGAAYYPERMDCQTEFHLISAHQKAGENDKPVKKVTAEARFVAARIRKLLDEGYPVTESDGTLRPCPFSLLYVLWNAFSAVPKVIIWIVAGAHGIYIKSLHDLNIL